MAIATAWLFSRRGEPVCFQCWIYSPVIGLQDICNLSPRSSAMLAFNGPPLDSPVTVVSCEKDFFCSGLLARKVEQLRDVMSRMILLRAPEFFKPLNALILLIDDILLAISSCWSRLSDTIWVRGSASNSTLLWRTISVPMRRLMRIVPSNGSSVLPLTREAR